MYFIWKYLTEKYFVGTTQLSAYLNLKPLVRIAEIRCDGIFLLCLDADHD